MAGLLDRGGDLLKSLAVGAAVSSNPLVGLLAMPAITKSREKREAENESMRRMDEFREGITDLAGRTETVQGPARGIGLLDPLSDNIDVMRVPGKRQQVPAFQTPEGQQQLMGMLAQVDPAAAAKAMMPDAGRSAPADQRMMQALGFPMTPEGFAAYKEIAGSGGDTTLERLIQMQMLDSRQNEEERRQQEAERAAEEAEREAATREEQKQMDIGMLESNVDNLIRLYELNTQLGEVGGVAGLLNRPGLPLAEGRRAASALLTPEQGAQFDEMSGLIEAIGLERLKVEGFDGNTNARFDAFMRTKPSMEFLGPANAKSIIRNLKGSLLADEAKGFVMDPAERARAEAFIQQVEDDGLNTFEVGDIVDGYEYIGGPRGDENSWRLVND